MDTNNFNPEKFKKKKSLTRAEMIMDVVKSNPDRIWRPRDIAEAAAIPQASIGTTLTELKQKGMLMHRKGKGYWPPSATVNLIKKIHPIVPNILAAMVRSGPTCSFQTISAKVDDEPRVVQNAVGDMLKSGMIQQNSLGMYSLKPRQYYVDIGLDIPKILNERPNGKGRPLPGKPKPAEIVKDPTVATQSPMDETISTIQDEIRVYHATLKVIAEASNSGCSSLADIKIFISGQLAAHKHTIQNLKSRV